jgi:ABC-type glycerol-3-phosphate transport system substrate-binding protein
MYTFILVLILALTSCTQAPGVLDVEVVPAEQALPAGEALQAIQPISLVILAGGPEERQGFVQYQTMGCTTQAGVAGQPFCRTGQVEGSQLQVFPLGGLETSFLRPEEIRQRLDFRVEDLYAVYRLSDGRSPGADQGTAAYGLLFDREEDGRPEPVAAIVQDGRLVRLDYFPDLTVDEVLEDIPLGQVILPPQDAKAWSAPLQAMQLQSQTFTSPDLRWQAQSLLALPTDSGERYYRRLIVTSVDGARYFPLVDEWVKFGLGYAAPVPLDWVGMSSTEFPALYWTYAPTPDGCVVFSNGSDLHRLDLSTGFSKPLLGPVGTWLAVSPDQGRVAAVGANGLAIYNLATGETRFAQLPTGQAGGIVWSPDGRELALTVAHNPCGDPAQATYSILRLDADSLVIQTLTDQDARRLATLDWTQLGTLNVADKDGVEWQMDPRSGQVWNAQAGRPTAAPAQVTEIRFFANLYEEDRRVLEQLANDFRRQRPDLRLSFNSTPQDNNYQHFDVNQYLTAVTRENDCFIDWFTPPEAANSSTELLNWGQVLAAGGPNLTGDFLPNQLEAYTIDGSIYGLPLFERPSVIYYNLDLLEEKGITPPVAGWNFDDFVRLIDSASTEQSGSHAYGFFGEESTIKLFTEGLLGSTIDAGLNPPVAHFDSPEMVQGLERLSELRNSGAYLYLKATLYADADYYAASDEWATGRVAAWQVPFGENPTNLSEAQPAFKIGIATLPVSGSVYHNPYSVQQGFLISQNSPNHQACLDWYAYISEHPEAFQMVPARRSMAESPAWRARVGEETAEVLRLAIERAYAYPLARYDRPVDPLLTWQNKAVRAYLDGADLQTVLQEAQRKADDFTACLTPVVQATQSAEVPWQEVAACARQVDPGLVW